MLPIVLVFGGCLLLHVSVARERVEFGAEPRLLLGQSESGFVSAAACDDTMVVLQ
jgi:hypothetical protein